jgi:hypothetical protein
MVFNELKPFYVEVSPSGCGLRFFCYGDLQVEGTPTDSRFATGPQDELSPEVLEHILQAKPSASDKSQNELELYTAGRHLSLTGDIVRELCQLCHGESTCGVPKLFRTRSGLDSYE